jgi:signal transduction histidine kinase
MNLTRLRWLTIVGPLFFLATVGFLLRGPLHEELHHFPGSLFVLAALTPIVAGFSFLVFAAIGRLEREAVERNGQLAALLAVGQAAASSIELVQLLDRALDSILSVTRGEVAEAWLPAEDGSYALARRGGLGPGDGMATVEEAAAAEERRRALGFSSVIAMTLRRGGEPVGVLAVAARRSGAFSGPAETRLLAGIGEQLAVAVENARLHERVLDLAVLEERERIARELHDGLAQVLGYINTQALAVKKLLSSGRNVDAEQEVEAMERAAKHVFTDVRTAIVDLRGRRDGLVPALRRYLADYGRIAGSELRLELGPEVAALSVPPSTEIQLLRIVQEALTNVRKHAAAATAVVRLASESDALTVEIADDGRGFSPGGATPTGWPRFGLQTMRERAEALGGRFELESSVGAGTRVRVTVPLAITKEVAHAGRSG